MHNIYSGYRNAYNISLKLKSTTPEKPSSAYLIFHLKVIPLQKDTELESFLHLFSFPPICTDNWGTNYFCFPNSNFSLLPFETV